MGKWRVGQTLGGMTQQKDFNCELMKISTFTSLIVAFSFVCGLQAQSTDDLSRLILDKNYAEAVTKGNEVLLTDSLNPQLYYYLGLAYSNLMKFDLACKSFEKADQLQPGNKSLILNLADCYCETADIPAAELLISDLLKADSTDPVIWLELAKIYQRQSKVDEAAQIYNRLWSSDSLNIWYPRQLGGLMIRNERYKEAAFFFEKVVEQDSSDQVSFLRLGQAYIKLKWPDKIPVLDKAIRQDSIQPLLYRYRGGLWFGTGNFKQSEIDLKTAYELGDSSAFTFRHLGISQFQQSKYQEALDILTLAVRIDSLDTESWYYLGFCYKWTEDLTQAISCLDRALKIAIPPSTGSIYSGLGLFYNLKRELKTAKIFYEKALEYNPQDAYPLSQIGLLIEQTTRDKELAKKYYERFLIEYAGGDRNLIDYVKDRLQIINEQLFMEGKLKK
jgi:tetratricopeptide (TPR) repeat protein